MKILVTGGASGLGASIVKTLAQHNDFTIYFTYSKSVDAAKVIEANNPNTTSFFCDFNNQSSLDFFIKKIPELEIDVLINNACGNIHKEHFHKIDPAIYLKIFERDIIPPIKITQEVFKSFRKRKTGKIINIISSAVLDKPPIGWSAYVANKSYLLSMSKSWATEGIRFNITSNCISPSFMLTNLTSDTDERIIDQMINVHPLKKLLTVDDVANVVLFFINCTKQVNGTNFIINAGENIF